MTDSRKEEDGPKRGRPRTFTKEKALFCALELFWQRGYENTSVTDVCKALGLTPPSLYAAFGSKARLFCEAVDLYETRYWDGLKERFQRSATLVEGVRRFFLDASGAMTLHDTPCGCLVVLATINASPKDPTVFEKVSGIRAATKALFEERLARAVREGELSPETDVKALAECLNMLLEGMSLAAKSGATKEAMERATAFAERLVGSKPKD